MQTFRLRKLLQKIPLDVEKKYLLLDALSKFQSPSLFIFTNYLLRIFFFLLLCFNVTICTLKHLPKINVSNIYIVDLKNAKVYIYCYQNFALRKKYIQYWKCSIFFLDLWIFSAKLKVIELCLLLRKLQLIALSIQLTF